MVIESSIKGIYELKRDSVYTLMALFFITIATYQTLARDKQRLQRRRLG